MIAVPSGENEREIYRTLSQRNPLALVAKGMSSAYIGFTTGPRAVAVYDFEECLSIVMETEGLTRKEAVSYLYEYVIPDETDENSPDFVVVR